MKILWINTTGGGGWGVEGGLNSRSMSGSSNGFAYKNKTFRKTGKNKRLVSVVSIGIFLSRFCSFLYSGVC